MKNCMPSGQTVKILNELTIIPIQVNDAKDITRENEKFNRVAIDVFLAAQVARQKGMPCEMPAQWNVYPVELRSTYSTGTELISSGSR